MKVKLIAVAVSLSLTSLGVSAKVMDTQQANTKAQLRTVEDLSKPIVLVEPAETFIDVCKVFPLACRASKGGNGSGNEPNAGGNGSGNEPPKG